MANKSFLWAWITATEENVVIAPAKPGIQKRRLTSLGFKRKAKNPAIATPRIFIKKIAISSLFETNRYRINEPATPPAAITRSFFTPALLFYLQAQKRYLLEDYLLAQR